MNYEAFVESKEHAGVTEGFDPGALPAFLFDFQRDLVLWALRKGRAAIFADCGLGKTPMELVWADQIARHTGGRVLVLTPLAVSHQTIAESRKFDIEAARSTDGALSAPIIVTNYERLHYFAPSDFAGVVCDESSILKSFDGERRKAITEFMRRIPYRLLATATAAPNDYIELGTSSEALGDLGHADMLSRFFKNDQNTSNTRVAWRTMGGGERMKWRFTGHAELPFWRWVTSWARALRKPSDLGYDDGAFLLPRLMERDHLVASDTLAPGMLFALPASGLREQREERRRTLQERCEMVSGLVSATGAPALVWCELNAEGDALEAMIDDAEQVSGKDSDDAKEAKLDSFARGDLRVLVTKPKIGAWGLNFQHCAHITIFPTHSYEQFYQGIRRCWRFGQTRDVVVDVVMTEGDKIVRENLSRKSRAADAMFARLTAEMTRASGLSRSERFHSQEALPPWLC